MFKSIRFALLAVALTAAAITSAGAAECHSSGARVGTVQKFSQKGVFNKSYEGELVQDGVSTKGKSGVTNVWKFSALDPAVARQIEAAALSGKTVALRYCQSMFHDITATNTAYTVVEVIPR